MFEPDEVRRRRLEANRLWREQNPDRQRENSRRYWAKNAPRVSQARWAKKQECIDIKGGKCFGCGECHVAALQFHHREGSIKLFNIVMALRSPNKYPWEIVLVELEKCDLLCANCHEISHYEADQERMNRNQEKM